MTFEDWVKNASKDLGEAVSKNVQNSDIWGSNSHKSQLLSHYLDYLNLEETKKIVSHNEGLVNETKNLVRKTHFLVIATIILSIVTFLGNLLLIYFGK